MLKRCAIIFSLFLYNYFFTIFSEKKTDSHFFDKTSDFFPPEFKSEEGSLYTAEEVS